MAEEELVQKCCAVCGEWSLLSTQEVGACAMCGETDWLVPQPGETRAAFRTRFLARHNTVPRSP